MSKVRAGAWVVLLALAGAQAWAGRFYPSPDGVSYLDLSDAVLRGDFRELLNAYWSPLYPVLIGALRAVLRPSAYWEFGVAHLLNFFLFAASLAAFEYFLAVLRQLGASHWGKPELTTTRGTVGAYAVFGALSLMMTPLTLPTPDLLVSASCFLVFGALLRLRYDIDVRRSALVLGIALAAGSLAKSFVIPWAGVCIATAFVAMRRRSFRPAIVAASIWLVAITPWIIGLTIKTGHLTFGDTGRLTYVWYVNRIESPSGKNMPHAAGTPATDSILRGIAITPDAAGTNPVWYDPARWYTDLHPRFDLTRQVQVIGILGSEYIASMAPIFLVLAFWLIAGGRAGVMEWWSRSWVVVLPALVALAAYSIVLVTTRYVAPFFTTLTLIVMCGARWPDRIPPARMLFAIGVPLILMVATPDPGQPMALINAAAGSVLFVWLARYRTTLVQAVMAVIGGVSIWFLQPFSDLRYVTIMSTAIILCYWIVAREADRREELPLVSRLTRQTLVIANAALVLFVAVLKYYGNQTHERISPDEPNSSWFVSRQAARANIGAGGRIALVGSPFEASYWVRPAGARIVAVVPPPRQQAFNQLAPQQRQRLYEEFTRAGARHVVVQQRMAPEGTDPTWTWVPNVGWVKPLR